MTAALDAIRARDAASSHEHMRAGSAGRDRRYLLAALDRAEAVVVAARKVDAAAFAGRGEGVLIADINRLRAALRAYEDADKVADAKETL